MYLGGIWPKGFRFLFRLVEKSGKEQTCGVMRLKTTQELANDLPKIIIGFIAATIIGNIMVALIH